MTINGHEITATEFGFDGCHKIYIIDSADDRGKLVDFGYDICPIAELQEAWDKSCPLRFIGSADLTRDYVNQFEGATIIE